MSVTFLVHPPVEVLEKCEIGCEQTFDHWWGDRSKCAQLGDHPGEQENRQVRLVVPHARIAQWQYLVPSRGQPHLSPPVDLPVVVHVAPRQLEAELSLQAGRRL